MSICHSKAQIIQAECLSLQVCFGCTHQASVNKAVIIEMFCGVNCGGLMRMCAADAACMAIWPHLVKFC